MKFSVVILAGGQSRRMGRDKAWLSIDGQPLLARQIALVRELAPTEVFVSGRAGNDHAALGCPVLNDGFAEAGPLAGIAAGLNAAAAIAVDLLKHELRAARTFAERCQQEGLVTLLDVAEPEWTCFASWNSPADVDQSRLSAPDPVGGPNVTKSANPSSTR